MTARASSPRSASAFAPGHITGLFMIFPGGSTGAGLNTARGATTSVCFADAREDTIYLNGSLERAEVSQSVIAAYRAETECAPLEVRHEIDYPIGFGMGMSGAGAFSLSLALNELLASGKSYRDCMEVAKRCEIACGTGLGDVVAQQYPGVMMGLPPYPSTEIQLIEGSERFVACAFFEPLSTGSIIRDPQWTATINRVGGYCMEQLSTECTRSKFMELSRHFTLETGLASAQVRAVLEAVKGSSMAMLGQSVFLLCETVAQGLAALSPHAEHVVVSEIAETGARLLARAESEA